MTHSNSNKNGLLAYDELFTKEEKKSPLWRLLFGRPVPLYPESDSYGELDRGYVTTGDDTIQAILAAFREGQHVMLVGPRGTGKSYMAGQAVKKVRNESRFGNVAVISIQGDPNKPPSDYFDDSISLHVENRKAAEGADNQSGSVVPLTVRAPMFKNAQPLRDGGFKTKESVLELVETLENSGKQVPVDRVVVFWDEGNRSSPAMHNAMLSLLAEGVIRRDGKEYRFPPVSCILTRNPDGYDAQSAKLPSPLIDRFAAQYYVFQPDLHTMVYVIAKNWLKDYTAGLQNEMVNSVTRLIEYHQASSKNPNPREWQVMEKINRDLLASSVEPPKINGKLETGNLPVVLKQIKDAKKEATTINDGLARMLGYCEESINRFSRVPDFSKIEPAAKRLALLVLATWGDARDPAEKPGMQYVPTEMRDALNALGKVSLRMRAALKRLGDRTRYGSSIRSYVNLLERLTGEYLQGKMPIDLGLLSPYLGALLNHRCETNFNPDREPASANEKTEALLDIANMILYPVKDAEKIDAILNEYIIEPRTEFTVDNLRDRDWFITELQDPKHEVTKFIQSHLSSATREALDSYKDSASNSTPQIKRSLARNLNQIVRGQNVDRQEFVSLVKNGRAADTNGQLIRDSLPKESLTLLDSGRPLDSQALARLTQTIIRALINSNGDAR